METRLSPKPDWTSSMFTCWIYEQLATKGCKVHVYCFCQGWHPDKTHTSKKDGHVHMLSKANDWKLLVDLPGSNYVFPLLRSTALPSALTFWSGQFSFTKCFWLNWPVQQKKVLKLHRWEKKDNITRNTSWKPKLLTVEVGVRGFVASNSRQAFLRLGLPRQKVSALCKKLASTAAKCSYTIYLAANSKVWDHDRPLLDQH